MGIQNSKALRIAVIAVIAGVVAWAAPRMTFVTVLSPSVHYSLMWDVGGVGRKGDYVIVPMPAQLRKDGGPTQLTKRVGCVSGEVLHFQQGQHYCNGVWLGAVLSRGSDGRKLKPFVWDGPIPEGKVYLVGDDPRSYDSRYLGFFDQGQTTRLRPIL
jgi:conjugal transfer pilin signal peptidase TrbI